MWLPPKFLDFFFLHFQQLLNFSSRTGSNGRRFMKLWIHSDIIPPSTGLFSLVYYHSQGTVLKVLTSWEAYRIVSGLHFCLILLSFWIYACLCCLVPIAALRARVH